MKLMVLYDSKTGNTKRMAEVIAEGMKRIPDTQVKVCSIADVDETWAAESSCIVLGTPTYLSPAGNAGLPGNWAELLPRKTTSTAAGTWPSASSSTI